MAAELNNIMIALTTARWKEVADTRDDAIINGKIMESLGRDGIETDNVQLSAAMDVEDDDDKINNVIKRVNVKLAHKGARAK